jgi:hypothetical protein
LTSGIQLTVTSQRSQVQPGGATGASGIGFGPDQPHLRELGLALQNLGVDWIRAAPARYAGLAARGCTFIERIEIAEISEEDASHD